MDPCHDLTYRTLESLRHLPAREQSRALDELLGQPLKAMSIYRVLEIRGAIVDTLDQESKTVRAAIDLIDGQIALREIAGDCRWR